jgi:hypothetical protein
MAEKIIRRDVFKIEDQNSVIRFGAKFLGVDGSAEKWSGNIPQATASDQQVVITNSEGKEYKVNKIEQGTLEDHTLNKKFFWIEGT